MNLAGIDLNLMLVFDAVMAERHVTKAGTKIGLSQPAVSNALNRLRYHLKDELFIRGPEGMRPTPRAEELAAPIRTALSELETALDPAVFDPATARRTFHIATSDYVVAVLIAPLMKHLSRHAPGIDLRLLPSAGRIPEMLDAQDIDYAISAFGPMPERFEKLRLFETDYVCLMREGHPLSTQPMTVKTYAEADHVLVTPRGDAVGFVDEVLAEKGLSRRVALTINQFAVAPAVVANSDLILTLPSRIADVYAVPFKLILQPCPLPAPPSYGNSTMIWHHKLAQHPAHLWFRKTVATVAQAL